MEILKINGSGSKQTYGCVLEDGGYPQLFQGLKAKPRFSYSWPDGSGEDLDPSEPTYFESVVYTFGLIFSCDSLVDFKTKYDALIAVLKAPNGSVWEFIELNKSIRLELQELTALQDIDLKNGRAKITLTLKNNWL